jgi:hydroxymethylglutaryl-CoA synthase
MKPAMMAAVLNSLAWLGTEECDGRYAIVVAADIAVYTAGPARPTGGCGAVAILLGPNAPITFEIGMRHSYMADVYDFCKPNLETGRHISVPWSRSFGA